MKNLTQLPWSGKGSKAKNDNTLGHAHAFTLILTLLLTFGVGQMLAGAGFYEVYFTYSYNSTNTSKTCTSSGTETTDLGTLTADFNINSMYLKYWKDGSGNMCGGLVEYYINSDQEHQPSWTWTSTGGNNHELSSTATWTVAKYNEGASGSYTFWYRFKTWGSTSSSSGCDQNFYVPTDGSSKNKFTYKIAPPAVSGFKITPSGDGYVSGTGTESDPYIMKHDEGNLVLTISGSQAHTDANSSAKYYNGSSWGTEATKTIRYFNGSTTKQSITLKMKYNNSTASLDGAISEKTVYYQRESTNTVSASAYPLEGGSVTPSSSTTTGQKSGIAISASNNTGYTFSGWSIVSGSGSFESATTTASNRFKPTSNTSLLATFTAKNYTVTLDKNGGDSNGSVQTTYNSISTSSFIGASRAGSSCDGYFTDPSTGSKVINADGTLVSETVSGWLSSGYWVKDAATITLYAHWKEDITNYTVTYAVKSDQTSLGTLSCAKTVGGEAVSSGSIVVSGTGVTFTASPITGYEVDAWCSNSACTTPIAGAGHANTYATSVTADLGVYVKFKKKIYTITYSPSSAPTGCTYTTKPTAGTYGNIVTMVITPSTGYTVSVSARDASSNVVTISNPSANTYTFIQPASAVTVTVSTSQIMSTLTTSNSYDVGDPSYAAPTKSNSSIGIATTATLTATPPSTGYTFAGWTLSKNLVVTNGNAATDLSITVRTNGNGEAATAQANYKEDLSSRWHLVGANVASKVTFPNGWTVDANSMMQKATGHSTESVVYANVTVSNADGTYEFKVVDDNGAGDDIWYGYSTGETYLTWTKTSTKNVYTGDGNGNKLKFTPTVTGTYQFKVDYSGTYPAVTITYPTSYTVTYSVSPDGAGGAITTSPSVSSGGKIAAGTSVTFTRGDANAGYEWYRWEDGSGSELGTGSTYTTTINANTTVVAKYTENTYNVTATASAGGSATPTGATSMGQITGGDITATPNTGYNFKDWTITSGTGYFGASGTSTTSTTANTKFRPTAAATVKATFAPKTTTITLNNQDATTPGTTEVTATYDAAMPAITLPEKTGYTFGGYFGAPGGGDPKYYNADGISAQNWNNVDATYTLYAKWTANGYTVTINVDEENKGTITGATTSQSVTYGAALTTIPNLPTAADGYGLDGYYTDQNGAGTKVINGDGTWIASVDGYTDADKKWIHADNVTLYAYYKQAEITELTLVETIVGTAGTDSITVTPVIAPLPAGTTIVCWEVQYSNGTALPSQPAGRLVSGNTYRFKAPTASATYRIQATLRMGSSCGGGSVLSTRAATFQVAGEHTVTVQYKCGDMTLAASSEVNARPLEWSGDITAPDITGYTFSGWVAGDGVTIKDGEDATATTHIKAVYDGTLTAVYNKKNMIFFNNTLGWENVYVYFYSSDKYWVEDQVEGQGCGTGSNPNYEVDGSKAYYRGYHGHMTQIEGTNIWYYDYEAEHGAKDGGEIKGYDDVVFVETEQNNFNFFYDNKASRRGDFKHSLSMFVPLNSVTKTKNGTKYYNDGYWMNYPENTGYTLKIYNYFGDNEPARTYTFPYSADLKMPLKLDVEFNNGEDFWFSIYRNDGVTMGKNCEVKQDNNDPQIITNTDNKLKVITSAPGTYSFTLSYTGTNYYIDVDYPAAVGDYRILYKDNATWAMGAHDGSWEIASDVINKNSGSEVKNDTVSFFVSKGNGINVTMKFQKITGINGSTGVVTWGDVDGGSISIPGSITEAGVYNFIVSQPAGGSSISLEKVEPYTGNYYIRTDCAGNTKWNNYKTLDHHMTYSDYAAKNSGFTHYYAHWVTSGTNVKFCIANDYSMCLTEQLSADYGTTIANIDGNGTLLSGSANIRFMWNQSTNKLSRAYIAGSGNITDRFLVLEGDAKMYDENGNALTGEHQDHNQYGTKLGTDNQVIMHDKENFVYERTIQVNTTARAKLTAKYNNNVQYFIGGAKETVELLGGAESDTKYTMRIVYDFKTNRLVTAYMPSNAAITEPLAINADIMLVREHQNAGQQLTFEGNGSLSAVKTVYGVMRFNRWTLNNKSTAAGHAPVGDPKSTYERSLYWISFPFDVNLSDVFGFGTYGTHWIIEYYDGAERATEGYWADSEGFWKYVTNRNGYKLEAGKGYILALDLDLMRDNNDSFWAHNIEQVELFFPSAAEVGNIKETDTEIVIPAHECTITARPGMSDDRTKKDSHWNIIGEPSYANYGSELKDGSGETITWNDSPATKDLPFLYEWNMVDNTYSVQSGTTYPFKSMHAYMVQYNGKLKWLLASATPSPVIARQTDAPKDVEFRIELQAGEKVADQTFVKMSTDEQISTAFDFNYDLSKQMNSGKANIYTMVEGYIQTAGNCLPMSEQTTVVPVGVKIAADGDYTFAIPEGTAGIGVTLIDTETGIRTNLSALTYTIALTAGTYDNRFVLEFSPIRNVPTEQPDVRSQKSEVSKVLIDGLLYIVRDNKMYDARGAMIMEK